MPKNYSSDVITKLCRSNAVPKGTRAKADGADYTGIDGVLRAIQRDIERTGNEAQRQRRRILLRGFRAALEALSMARLDGDLMAVDDALREEIFASKPE